MSVSFLKVPVLKASLSCVSLTVIIALTACGGGSGGSSGGASTPTPAPDSTAPVVTFNPASLTIESELSVDVTLTATDNVRVTSGPTVACTNGGVFSDNVFTSPVRITPITSVCTATASDAAGNTGQATLTVMVVPRPDFSRVSDTLTVNNVLGHITIPTEPGKVVGISQDPANGTVSTFAATATGFGEFDDPVLTAQSTLGTVGTAPLDVLFADESGLQDGLSDLVFLDEVNDQIIAVPLNADNTYGLPITQSVPNACAAGRGARSVVSRAGSTETTRTDILVGTTNGLFHVGAGDVNGDGGSGLSAPTPIVTEGATEGNFCNLFVDRFVSQTLYAVYNPDTQGLTAFQESGRDSGRYNLIFTSDISDRVSAGAEPLLFDGFQDGFGLDKLYNVFKNPQGGTRLVQSYTGSSRLVVTYDLDIESPTDILTFKASGREILILVSPTSETAIYIPDVESISNEVKLIEIGLGFDKVDYSDDAGSLIFSSSTKDSTVIRRF